MATNKMYQTVTFINLTKVTWNYELQAMEKISLLKYDKSCGLHGSWLNKAILDYMQGKFHKKENIFITCDENQCTIEEKNLFKFLEIVDKFFKARDLED